MSTKSSRRILAALDKRRETKMKLQTLIEELERQKPLKWDRKVHSTVMEIVSVENDVRFRINGNDPYPITRPCHDQIAEKLEIPVKYYRRMEAD